MVSPTRTDSLYAQLQPLTTVAKSRFVDYFTGDALGSWSELTVYGSPTFLMDDSVNGGFKITCTTAGHQGVICFNDKRQFSKTGSVIIMLMKRATSNCIAECGFDYDPSANVSHYSSYWRNSGAESKTKLCNDGNGSSVTSTDSTTNVHTDFALGRIENSASSAKLFENGLLTATSTSDLSTKDFQPFFSNVCTPSSATTVCHISYLEAYNT